MSMSARILAIEDGFLVARPSYLGGEVPTDDSGSPVERD